MRKRLFIIVTTMLLMPMGIFGQNYQNLWKQVEDAQRQDLPQTALAQVDKIVQKAEKEKDYGQLLKSTLLRAQLQAEVAPDSLRPAVARLEAQEQQARDEALQAVYATVLSVVCAQNPRIGDDWQTQSQYYRTRAMAHPDALAKVQTDAYVPFVVKGKDSEVFGHDLLSVVAQELQAWAWLSDYYDTHNAADRRARCTAAFRAVSAERPRGGHAEEHVAESAYIRRLDSLIALYGDLAEACEIAIERYDYMDSDTDASAAELAAWLQEALRRWGTAPQANRLRNSWSALTQPTYQARVPEKVAETGKGQTVTLTQLRHLQTLTMRVYRTRLEGDTALNPNDDKDYKQLKPGLQELTEHARTLTFTGHPDYEAFEDSLQLAALPAGVYMLEFQSQPATRVSRQLYFVSGVRLLTIPLPGDRTRYVVVNATTGQPLAGASVRLGFSTGWNKPRETKTLMCNPKGELVYKAENGKRPNSAFAYTNADKYCPESNSYGRYSYYERQYGSQHTSLFTDRSIYRPGQTVHVAAVVWREQSADDNVAVAGQQLTLELRDANFKEVAVQQVVTDRFGKCSAQFTLPKGLLNGRFTVRTTGASMGFRVEEYKRPAFRVEFPEYKETYKAGDVVRAEAKALTYAGVPVQGAKVKYTVRRRVAWWWMTYSSYWQGGYAGRGLNEEVLSEGEAVTADDGTFTVEMPMTLPADGGRASMFYNFTVEADVTDQAGETHTGSMTLPLGSKPTVLTCDLPQQVRRDQLPKVTFSRRNAAGHEVAGTVRYRTDGGKWQQAAANSPVSALGSQLKSGEHRLEAVCEQDTVDMRFVVFSLDDKRPATQTSDWFYVSDPQFPRDGKPVTVQVGSSDPDVHIVYALFAGNDEVESGAVDKNGELINSKFTYEEDYGSGLLVTYAWVKNGQCHIHQQNIPCPQPDKQLRLQWETFRDRLTPGQQEEWRLKIQTPDGKPADASLLAVLYDKSLDQIASHQWTFAPTNYRALPATAWQWTTWGNITARGEQDYKRLSEPTLAFSHFDSSVFPHYVNSLRMLSRGNVRMAKMAAADASQAVNYAAKPKTMMTGSVTAKETAVAASVAADNVAGEEEEQREADVQLRENLQETAFCYPAVETDKDGQVVLRFTLPESLTTWRFMGVANTPQMLYGQIDGEAVAQKDVMVQPNVPRFLRMGDEAQLSARIYNTADRAVSGTARLTLIDPECDHVVLDQSVPFAVEAGQTAAVTFSFTPDETYSLLVCKVVAAGDGFSDGEQHYVPVLPDRERVIRTVPVTQHAPGVETIDLTKLFPAGTTQQKLTVEYTNNPAWLMVQALPVLAQPWEHSAIDQAAAYYSNQLARTLLKQSPQAKAAFEQWKREDSEEPTLASQLQKDESLKDLVLSETPWVGDADREAEQRQRLADFFDENVIGNRLATALAKLQKLQNADGSFSWYPGMPGSTMVTVAVQEMLTRLTVMTGSQDDVQQLQAQAFGYVGHEMADLVQELKKQKNPTFPTFTALRWLYLCALDGRALPADVRAANEYLIKLLKKDIKRQTIYEKALTAVVLARHGEAKLAQQYVQSLKEYSVFTAEMGRYYDTPRASYSWYDYKIPTEVAAIEAIQAVSPDDRQTVDEMRRWLLQEKRTQAWDTPISSVNAVWAFLHGAASSLDAAASPTVLAIDGQPLTLPKATAGLGYVKTAISSPEGRTLTATKTSEGTSWGAVYAQYMQKTADVEASQSGVTVRRELLTDVNGQWTAVSGQCTVGQRIKVRITVETTRDLDFVQVVDRRAACMEPVRQLSGYHNGAYVSPKDNATHYFYYGLAKGRHTIETEYYIDRAGRYETGTCTAGCAYAPEFRATAPSMTLRVE